MQQTPGLSTHKGLGGTAGFGIFEIQEQPTEFSMQHKRPAISH
jgi:hypothetical protein